MKHLDIFLPRRIDGLILDIDYQIIDPKLNWKLLSIATAYVQHQRIAQT